MKSNQGNLNCPIFFGQGQITKKNEFLYFAPSCTEASGAKRQFLPIIIGTPLKEGRFGNPAYRQAEAMKIWSTMPLNILYDRNTSEDMVQETFIFLWEKADKIVLKTSLKGYLYAMVRNKSLNFLKAVKITDDVGECWIQL